MVLAYQMGVVEWNDCSVSWAYTDAYDAQRQLNGSGAIYDYVAIG